MWLIYLLFGFFILLAFLGLARWFVGANPKTLARGLWAVLIGLGGLLAAVLLARGLLHLALVPAALAGLAWRMMRRPAAPGGWGPGGPASSGGPTAGGQSDVTTDWLHMTLDHGTGSMNGTVRRGRFEGRALDSLSLDDLLALLAACQADDAKSATLLEAYLDRVHGPDWRAHAEAGAGAAGSGGNGQMDRREALEILGLGPNPSRQEIRDAHRNLMQKNHPDRGGSVYLAAKINRAKDVLLGG